MRLNRRPIRAAPQPPRRTLLRSAEPVVTIGHEVGMQAPDFTVETVAGESFNLSDVNAAGSPVLLYFFATW